MTKKLLIVCFLFIAYITVPDVRNDDVIFCVAVSILVDNYNTNTNIIQNKQVIDKVIGQISYL